MEDINKSYTAKLLIINDEPNLSDLSARWLKTVGYYHEFIDGDEEATKRMKYEDFDVVVRSHEFLTIKGLSAQFQPL